MNISELNLESGFKLSYIKSDNFRKLTPEVSKEEFDQFRFAVRLNALSMIKAAGSGHVGSSFSATDLFLGVKLFLFNESNGQDLSNNILFSSKGHDAPGQYSILHAFGLLPDSSLFTLRTLNGLPGHPEIGVPSIKTNTGSLGMGISKAKGMCIAKKLENDNSKVVVILGDGELQEGQIWESMPGAAFQNLDNLVVIVDGNKIQSDSWVEKTLPIGNLKSRVESYGWEYFEIDGHSFKDLSNLPKMHISNCKPKFIYANTVKGSGVSFMEKFSEGGLFYKFHSGSPSDDDYSLAKQELILKIKNLSHEPLVKELGNQAISDDLLPKDRTGTFIESWSSLLISKFKNNKQLFALDADLAYDTGTHVIREHFPDRYLECGIAEQDMVSMAGGLSISGYVPIVHSFASFLINRSAEQIFNNYTEGTNIIYVGFLAGILPSAPGHSHQAVNDVGIISTLPNFPIFIPSCDLELEQSFSDSLIHNGPSYIRIESIGKLQQKVSVISKLKNLNLRIKGTELAIITAGPTFSNIAIEVANAFENNKIALYTRPHINQSFNAEELRELSQYKFILIIENYLPANGIYQNLLQNPNKIQPQIIRIGINEIPRNGRTQEVLVHHNLDTFSIHAIISSYIND